MLDLAGPRLRTMLANLDATVTDRLITLAAPPARAAMARDHLADIVRLVQRAGGGDRSISIVEAAEKTPDPEPRPDAPAPSAPEPDVSDAEDHPLVREAARVFGARVARVQPKRK